MTKSETDGAAVIQQQLSDEQTEEIWKQWFQSFLRLADKFAKIKNGDSTTEEEFGESFHFAKTEVRYAVGEDGPKFFLTLDDDYYLAVVLFSDRWNAVLRGDTAEIIGISRVFDQDKHFDDAYKPTLELAADNNYILDVIEPVLTWLLRDMNLQRINFEPIKEYIGTFEIINKSRRLMLKGMEEQAEKLFNNFYVQTADA